MAAKQTAETKKDPLTNGGLLISDQESVSERNGTIETTVKKEPELMQELVRTMPVWPATGTLLEGTVIGKRKNTVYLDVPPFGTAIIFGREYLIARDIIRKVNLGDTVAGKVIDPEGEEGYIELSLQEARKALIWDTAERAMKQKESFELIVKEANKGGLIMEWHGIEGFLPASQLKSEHYPRVKDGDKDKIMVELGKLVGEKISATIIGIDPREGKLIFSEKNMDNEARREILSKYSLGDVIEGEVTGTVDFGVFVKVEEGLEGLVHISEIDWSLVEDPKTLFKTSDHIRAKVIDIKDGKISLSFKALKDNPWRSTEKKYHKGDRVTGVVIKYNKYGALASIEEGVAGLVHISEFENEDELRQTLELGKSYSFIINIFDPKEQRLTLLFHDKEKADKKPEIVS